MRRIIRGKATLVISVILLVSLCSAVSAWIGFQVGKFFGKGEGMYLAELAETGKTLRTLRDLREGKHERALMLLETVLDGHILTFGLLPEACPNDLQERAAERLVWMKQYRLDYPRDWSKREEMASGPASAETVRTLRDPVEKILATVHIPKKDLPGDD